MKKFLKEFKEFALRGNVLDLAVGVVVGGAFSKIVTALVENIFMPVIGIIIGGIDISGLSLTIGTGENAAVLAYGAFLTTVIDFFLIALCVFLFVKLVNSLWRKKKVEEAVEEPKRLCPYCRQEVDAEATRCPHCTSQLDVPAAEEE
ncbi:large conductance mechanosensitive channel protein MscL [Christensenellaceae bacterium NSJ-63]|uniref:Large-conductance mechanosensitive channel n=1 Tax=Guopingia tenuis TaxID=2763656 RepID=A0A926HVY9_9FIRM|nr:large conductance mechanosensitive channel protein MscL [Guopingia tenuis]MBC8537485.1 large conductance mechanosensitive channel protein MscL [Guopingia tenuis]